MDCSRSCFTAESKVTAPTTHACQYESSAGVIFLNYGKGSAAKLINTSSLVKKAQHAYSILGKRKPSQTLVHHPRERYLGNNGTAGIVNAVPVTATNTEAQQQKTEAGSSPTSGSHIDNKRNAKKSNKELYQQTVTDLMTKAEKGELASYTTTINPFEWTITQEQLQDINRKSQCNLTSMILPQG